MTGDYPLLASEHVGAIVLEHKGVGILRGEFVGNMQGELLRQRSHNQPAWEC